MIKIRKVLEFHQGVPTVEGAGVHLKRAFGRVDARLDPFLLFDDFSSDKVDDYSPGFPWHPHRGIETITYILDGRVAHGDSLGNKGEIGPGEVQWMTAGSGIIHEEMPVPSKKLTGFQLWANLPKTQKMMPPRYRDIHKADIPVVSLPGDAGEISVIAGEIEGARGPADDIVIKPVYLDILLKNERNYSLNVPADHNSFVYIIDGSAKFAEDGQYINSRALVIFDEGDTVTIQAGETGTRLLFIAGKSLREPVAWGGPIVMNTEEELQQAFREVREGTFIK
jgi:hypothetical protein